MVVVPAWEGDKEKIVKGLSHEKLFYKRSPNGSCKTSAPQSIFENFQVISPRKYEKSCIEESVARPLFKTLCVRNHVDSKICSAETRRNIRLGGTL
jgi:hypothetical protein